MQVAFLPSLRIDDGRCSTTEGLQLRRQTCATEREGPESGNVRGDGVLSTKPRARVACKVGGRWTQDKELATERTSRAEQSNPEFTEERKKTGKKKYLCGEE